MSVKIATRWVLIAASATVLILGASSARAEMDIDLRGGYNADAEDALIGGGVLTPFADSHRWFLNPNAEVTLMDEGDQFSLNGDFHYDFETTSRLTYWVGAGPMIEHRDLDIGGDDTDLGVNVLAGMGARSGNVRPFTQGKVVLKDDTEAAIAIGIRF